MPHIPRRVTNPAGVPPELVGQPTDAHPPIAKPAEADKPRVRVGLDKINMHTYEPDMEQLVKTLLGKEASCDSTSGVVLPASSAQPITIRAL